MLFQYYFVKDGQRSYDKSELITYLKAQKYTSYEEDGVIKKIYYKNTLLKFDATFVISNRSMIPRLDKLDPNFLDTNFYVEFDLLTNEYKVNRLLDIIQVICQEFDFYAYNSFFEKPVKCDREIMLNVLRVSKTAYKSICEKEGSDEFLHYAKMAPEKLDKVYSYIESKESLLSENNCEGLDYIFVKKDSSRQAMVSIDMTNLTKGVIIPPGVFLVKVKQKDKSEIYTKFEFVYKKISKYLTSVPANINYQVYYISDKNIKKVNKVLLGTKFDRVESVLYETELSNIYDL